MRKYIAAPQSGLVSKPFFIIVCVIIQFLFLSKSSFAACSLIGAWPVDNPWCASQGQQWCYQSELQPNGQYFVTTHKSSTGCNCSDPLKPWCVYSEDWWCDGSSWPYSFCRGGSIAPINLTALNVAVTPAKPMTSQTTSVTATILNDGTSGTAAEFWVMLTLDCVPDVLDASCARTGAQRLTALGAGAEQSVTFPDLPAISGTGSHTYYVKADYGTEIVETNENDNIGSIAFNVCGVSTKPTINTPPVCSNIATPQLTVTDRGGSCYPHDAYFLVESKIGGIYSFAQNNWMYSSLVSLNSQASWNPSTLLEGVYRWKGAAKPAGVDTSFMTYSDPSTDFAIDLTKPQAPSNLTVTTGCTGGPGTGTATITWSASSD